MTSKLVVVMFRSKLDVQENKYALILKVCEFGNK